MKKIVGIVVYILLIATILPAIGTMNINDNTIQYLELRTNPQKNKLLSTIPDDEYFSLQYSLHNTGQTGGIPDCDIDAPEAWDLETGNSTVIIAFIDSGIDYTHPDLTNKIWNNLDEIPDNDFDDDGNGYIDDLRGWDFYDNDNDPLDENGHGTICAGIAAAVTNNNEGIAGVCWNCQIMPLKVNGLYNTEDVPSYWIEAIEYAVDNGADIISMSLGIEYYHTQLENAVNYAYNNGIFLTASAGNQGWSDEHYPAAYDNVVGVAATNDEDKRMENAGEWSASSNYGLWIDVAAPGENIFSIMPTYPVYLNNWFPQNYSGDLCGTSCSAPHVAGLAALLLSKNSSLNPDEVKSIICENVDPYNSTEYIGTGRINAYKALNAMNQPPIAPTITGETKGIIGVEYEYTFNSVDPDDNDVYYYIDWGDGQIEEWIGPYNSGEIATVNHIWTSPNDYEIIAKSKDTNDLESIWSDVYPVIIVENEPPNPPTIDGPYTGKTGIIYEYDFSDCNDPDGDNMTYRVEWGDDCVDEGFVASGVGFTLSHTWTKKGNYIIKAKLIDDYDVESEWATFDVSIPRTRTSFHWMQLLDMFPVVQRILNLLH
jgi:subtilisin family serine protease